jgi:hypothetical protein
MVDVNYTVPEDEEAWNRFQQQIARRKKSEGTLVDDEKSSEKLSETTPVKVKSKKAKKDVRFAENVDRHFYLSVEMDTELRLILSLKRMKFSDLMKKLIEDYLNKCQKDDEVKEFFSRKNQAK